MKRIAILSALTALVIAGGTVSALAHDRNGEDGQGRKGPKGPQIPFAELDADGDGKVTQAELDAHFAAHFATIDTDGNGTLSAEELAAEAQGKNAERMAKRTARMMERMDANGDGVLSLEEMQPKNGDKMFARLDTDGDGAISEAEFEAMKAHRGKGHGKGFGQKGRDNN